MACAADLYNDAMTNPGVDCLYITTTRTAAKRIIWKDLNALFKRFGGLERVDRVELTFELTNGSKIYLSGAKDTSEIDKFRGMALYKVYIDEAQSFPAYLFDLIKEVLEPALLDYNGSLCLIGTPPPIEAGVFHDAFHRKAGYQGYTSFHWTIKDNPHIEQKSGKTVEELLKRVRDRNGWTADNPTYRREYLGQFVYDPDSLVYKFDKSRNLYDSLPDQQWNYIIGVDIGFNDADAVAVLAFSKHTPDLYLVEELVQPHQDITALVEMVKPLVEQYNPIKVVMDAGALGKKIQEEISRRHGQSWKAADKHRKFEFIELMNGDLRKGNIKVLDDTMLVHDWNTLQWDFDPERPDKLKISTRYHSDIADAFLYAWREALHFTYRTPEKKPVHGSEEWMDEWAEQQAAIAKHGNDTEWWEH